MSEKNVPEVRFRGFSGEWENKYLETEVDFYSGLTYSPLNIVESNGTLVLRSSNVKNGEVVAADNVYVNSSVVNCQNVKTGDIIVVVRNGSRGLIGKHGQIKTQMDNTVIGAFMTGVQAKQPDFTNALLDTVQFNREIEKNLGATINQITTGSFKKMSFYFTDDTDEQTKIGEFFKTLDNLIAQNQKKYDKLVNMKKACLDKLFPKDGADTPEVRFQGFRGEWERCKFRKIVDKYEEPVQTPTDGYMRLGIRSHAKGTFHSYVEKGRELQTAKMHKVVAGNFIVNITFGWEHAVAVTGEDDAGKLVSHRFPQFKFCDGMVPKYFKYVIIDTNFRHHLWLSSPGGAGRNRVLKIDEMLEYEMIFPCENEQTKIGTFFQTLDNLITLRKTELDKIKNIKKACLDKMFI